jgi:RimJ/RimL family protein N-acetyltransferase
VQSLKPIQLSTDRLILRPMTESDTEAMYTIFSDPGNTASVKTLERLSFLKEGYLRERWIVNDEIPDSDLYGLLSSDRSSKR